jgi:hypothetical protein
MDNYKSQNIWEERIKERFQNKSKKLSQEDILWNIINLLLYQNSKDTTLVEIYKLFDNKMDFVKLMTLLDGRTFKAPKKEDIIDALLFSILYYEKEIEGNNWDEIQKNFNFEFSPIKYGIRIRNLKNWLNQKLSEIMRKNEEISNE